jgi:multidrug efflux system membrane fusion protein
VSNAKFNLDNTTVRAPISGRTGSVLMRQGNLVHASGSTPLVVINQVRPILVRFAVPGTQLPLIVQYGSKGGLPVSAIPGGALPTATPNKQAPVPADSAKTVPVPGAAGAPAPQNAAPVDAKGTLSFIDNAVDTTTATVMLKATFPNETGSLWAGQFVSTSLRLFVEKDALVIPAQAVVSGQMGTYVYVIDSAETAEQRSVVVERNANGLSVIADGLREGERVVTDGQSKLTPGAAVNLRTATDTGSAPPSGRGRGGRGGGRGGRGRGGSRNGQG